MKKGTSKTDDGETKAKAQPQTKSGRASGYYKAQFARTDANRKRTLVNYIRDNPTDTKAWEICAQRYSESVARGAVSGATSKGRRVLDRASRSVRILRSSEAQQSPET